MELEFGGKHRGIVVDNNDPLKLGRIKIRVDASYGNQPTEQLPWAYPCMGYGGMPEQAAFAVPEVGAGIWVEFQWRDGKPDTTHPVWVGTWSADGETPGEVEGDSEEAHFYKVFKTTSGHFIRISDKDDEQKIEVQTQGGHLLIFHDKEDEKRIELKTDGGHHLMLDDKNKTVELGSSTGHRAVMDEEQLLLEDKDGSIIKMKGGDIDVQCDGDFNAQASGEVVMKASAIRLN